MPIVAGKSIVTAQDLGITVAQSVPFDFTLERQGNFQLLWATVIYTSSAVVSTRRPVIEIIDPDLLTQTRISSAGTQPAAFTIVHAFAQGDAFFISGSNKVLTAIPRDVFLQNNWILRFRAEGAGAGDMQSLQFQLRGP